MAHAKQDLLPFNFSFVPIVSLFCSHLGSLTEGNKMWPDESVLNCDQFRLDQTFVSLQQDCAARRSPAKGIGSVTLPFLFEFEAILALNLYCFIYYKAIMKAIPQSWAVNSLSSPEHTIILDAAIWPQLLRKSRKLRVKGLVFSLYWICDSHHHLCVLFFNFREHVHCGLLWRLRVHSSV